MEALMADPNHIKHIKDTVDRVKSSMRITKVVATRAVKTKRGDFFAGMSAAWESTQDDAAGGADLDLISDTSEQASAAMTLEDSKVAHIILSMECSIAAHRAALSEGAISENLFNTKVQQIKRNALAHLSRVLPYNEAQKKVEVA